MRKLVPADLQAEALEVTIDGHTTRLEVLPRLGANLVSLQVDGREFLHFDREMLFADPPHMRGCFQMFPSPCRLSNSSYLFQGQEIHQRKHGEDYFIHGLVRDETFALAKTATELVASLEWDRRHPVYEGFPWEGALTTTFRPIARGRQINWAFQNRSDSPAPAGYGLHPFWQIPGARAEAFVTVPAEYRLELVDYTDQRPTGKTIPVAGTHYDLREGRSLLDLYLDDIYWPKTQDPAEVLFRDEEIRLTLQCSENMKHMVCYSPEGRAFVCVENLSCSPDAQNLYAKGLEELSGLGVVPPGETLSGWVRYQVEEA
jgi:aldose 1-epimerase